MVTMSEVRLWVPGNPAPKGSYRAVPTARGTRLLPASPREKQWRALIVAAALAAGYREPAWGPDEPLTVEAVFHLPRGRTVKRLLPTVPPDVDKLARCLLDGLTDARLIGDDKQVVTLNATKCYATPQRGPGVEIIVKGTPND